MFNEETSENSLFPYAWQSVNPSHQVCWADQPPPALPWASLGGTSTHVLAVPLFYRRFTKVT
jgi:hypothetical protein